jgi:hypothetical protein
VNGSHVYGEGVQTMLTFNQGQQEGVITVKDNVTQLKIAEHGNIFTKDDLFVDDSRLYAETQSGKKHIKTLPDEGELTSVGFSTIETIELKATGPNPIYSIQGKKQSRFLGIFSVNMAIGADIDTENGKIVSLKKPWWSFLAW